MFVEINTKLGLLYLILLFSLKLERIRFSLIYRSDLGKVIMFGDVNKDTALQKRNCKNMRIECITFDGRAFSALPGDLIYFLDYPTLMNGLMNN